MVGYSDAGVLGELCAFAPSMEIRDCLRLYSQDKSGPQLMAAFTRKNKVTISNTLEYLGMSLNWDDYMKSDVVHELICRIQNLLPDECSICKEQYCVKKDDPRILPCKRCGQDIHKSCIRNILGIDEENLSSTEIYKLINPFGLSFLYYLCGNCEKSLFVVEEQVPKRKNGNKELLAEVLHIDDMSQSEGTLSVEPQISSLVGVTINKVDDIAKETQEIPLSPNVCNSNRGVPATLLTSNKNSIESYSHFVPAGRRPTPLLPDIQVLGNSESMKIPQLKVNAMNDTSYVITNNNIKCINNTNDNQLELPPRRSSKPIVEEIRVINSKQLITCRYYIKGLCKHGANGRNCKFNHPKPCTKLLKHGTNGNVGCNKGKECNFFHPKMCSTSLTKGVCDNRVCTLKHVKGTKFSHNNNNSNIPSMRNVENKTGSNQHDEICKQESSNFLDVIRLLKTELLEAMDRKISSVLMNEHLNRAHQPMHHTHPIQPHPHPISSQDAGLQQQRMIQSLQQHPQHQHLHQYPTRWC